MGGSFTRVWLVHRGFSWFVHNDLVGSFTKFDWFVHEGTWVCSFTRIQEFVYEGWLVRSQGYGWFIEGLVGLFREGWLVDFVYEGWFVHEAHGFVRSRGTWVCSFTRVWLVHSRGFGWFVQRGLVRSFTEGWFVHEDGSFARVGSFMRHMSLFVREGLVGSFTRVWLVYSERVGSFAHENGLVHEVGWFTRLVGSRGWAQKSVCSQGTGVCLFIGHMGLFVHRTVHRAQGFVCSQDTWDWFVHEGTGVCLFPGHKDCLFTGHKGLFVHRAHGFVRSQGHKCLFVHWAQEYRGLFVRGTIRS
ncbi:unnamed protein product [Sphenostylis stenocarpa]|uniref:Uncharacterized protein n=1 Tax=Sphenostylis stenocarpa TaxID=92480 RepID=A0AA86S3T4_9FABA|nr:unnamed protein product [Sphenostylis stenocarpa]